MIQKIRLSHFVSNAPPPPSRTYPTKIFRRFSGLFWPLFESKLEGNIHESILPSNFESKSGSKEPENRLKFFSGIGSTVKQKMGIALKILRFPIWGPYMTCKYGVQRLAMIPVYPAQSRLLQQQIDHINPASLHRFRESVLSSMQKEGFLIREVIIERNRVQYHGFMISRPKTKENGKWILQAAGNAEAIEYYSPIAKEYAKAEFNTLLINGPSVGKSKGCATPKSMGEAQESGLQFLETHLKATKIAIAGFSLGGAAIGQAILQHQFKSDVEYLVIRQLTFDRLSNIVRKILDFPILSRLAPKVIHWTELEMDNILVSKKLQTLKILEIVIQASNKSIDPSKVPNLKDFAHDGIIPKTASLGYRLVKEGITENKTFLCIPFGRHLLTWPAYELTRDLLKSHFADPLVASAS